MSDVIETQVVRMEFDNERFNKNIKNTVSQIDQLKEKIKFNRVNDDFKKITSASEKVDLSSIQKATEKVNSSFNAMRIFAITAVANLSNDIVNYSKKMVSALTIDPIKTGLNEYETKINAIQTIMSNTSSKGTVMSDVTKVINELNTYADKTIYNFAEMTRNIGTFTAAGVGLKDSASAIQGIANLAAASGSNSQQASTAMYQLSQALAAGSVKLMDWNSVVNAGMGGEKFQEALKQTAREHHIAVDNMITRNGSFRESLQEGWITADVLNDTLRKFTVDGAKEYAKTMQASDKWTQAQADALLTEARAMEEAATKVKTFTQLIDTMKESVQSGWGQTWEILLGNFEEAKEMFSDISDVVGGVIGVVSDARNEWLSGALSSGWSRFMDFSGLDESILVDAIKKINKAQEDAIISDYGKDKLLYGLNLDERISQAGSFQKTLKNGWLTADTLEKSIASVVEQTQNLSDVELENIGYTRERINKFLELNTAIQNGTLSLDEFVASFMKESGRENIVASVMNIFNGLGSVLKPLRTSFINVFNPYNVEALYSLTDGLRRFTETLVLNDETVTKLERTFNGVFSVVSLVTSGIKALAQYGLKVLNGVISVLVGPTSGGILSVTANLGDMLTAYKNWVIENDIIGKRIEQLNAFLYKARVAIGNFIKQVLKVDNLSDIFTNIQNSIDVFFKDVKQLDFEALYNKVVQSVKEFMSKISSSFDFSSATNNMKTSFAQMSTNAENGFDNIKKVFDNICHTISSIISYITTNMSIQDAIAILISTTTLFAIKKVSDILKVFSGPIDALTNVFKSVEGVIKAYSFNMKSQALLKIAIALGILTAAIVVLSNIETDKLKKAGIALAALAVGILVFSAALALISKIGNVSGLSRNLLVMVMALGMLSLVFDKIMSMDMTNVETGIYCLIGGLITFAVAVKILNRATSDLYKSAFAMVLLSVAIAIFVKAISSIENVNFTSVLSTLVTLGLVIATIYTTLKVTKVGVDIRSMLGLFVLSIALVALINSLLYIAKKDLSPIYTNIDKLIMIFGLLSIVMMASSLTGKHAMKAGVMVLAISLSLVIMIQVIKMLGDITKADIRKGNRSIIEIMKIFALVIVASTFAGKYAVKAGVMLLLMSGAMVALTGVIIILGSLKADSLSRAVKAISTMGIMFAVLIASTKHMSADGLKNIIGITVSIVILVTSLTLLSIIDSKKLLSSTLSLVSVMGALALVIVSITIMNKSTTMTNVMKSVILMSGLVVLLAGLVWGLSLIQSEHALSNILALSTLIVALSASVVLLSVAGRIGGGVIAGVGFLITTIATFGGILGALGALNKYAPQAQEFMNSGLPLLETVGTGIGGLIGSILGGALSSFATSATEDLSKVGDNLSAFAVSLEPFFEMVQGIDENATTGVKNLAETMLLLTGSDILSTIGGWIGGGGNSIESFSNNLSVLAVGIKEYIDVVSEVGVEAITAADSTAKVLCSIAEFAKNIPNEGGVAAFFMGDNTIGAFTDNLKPLAEALVDFSTTAGSINIDNVIKAEKASNILTTIADAIPNTGGLVSLLSGDNDISDFGDKLVSFATSVSSFQETVSMIKVEVFDDFITVVNTLVKTLSINLEKDVSDYYTSYYASGKNVVAGFIKGIQAGVPKIYMVTYAMGKEAKRGLSDSLDEHSPSKEAYKSGAYFVVGFVNAVRQLSSMVKKESVMMGNNAIDGLSKATNDIYERFQNGIDTQPRIKPIIDLSDMKSKTKTIDSYFSKNKAMSIDTNVRTSHRINNESGSTLPNSNSNTIQFTQNNYSPKALSSAEIYRQTRNQFSRAREMVRA